MHCKSSEVLFSRGLCETIILLKSVARTFWHLFLALASNNAFANEFCQLKFAFFSSLPGIKNQLSTLGFNLFWQVFILVDIVCFLGSI